MVNGNWKTQTSASWPFRWACGTPLPEVLRPTLLIHAPVLVSFPLLAHVLIPLPAHPGINSQLNHWPSNLCLRVYREIPPLAPFPGVWVGVLRLPPACPRLPMGGPQGSTPVSSISPFLPAFMRSHHWHPAVSFSKCIYYHVQRQFFEFSMHQNHLSVKMQPPWPSPRLCESESLERGAQVLAPSQILQLTHTASTLRNTVLRHSRGWATRNVNGVP